MAKSTDHSFLLSSRGLAVMGLIGFASYFLLIEHRQHLFEFLPYLILLLCPLMHLFMHGGHGHKHGASTDSGPQPQQSEQDATDKEGYQQGRKDALRNNDKDGENNHGQ